MSTTTATTTTITATRTAATMDRPRLFFHRNRELESQSDSEDEVERPRSYSLPSVSRNIRTIERHRHLARRNRNVPQFAVLSDRLMDNVALRQPREPPRVEDAAETEEEG